MRGQLEPEKRRGLSKDWAWVRPHLEAGVRRRTSQVEGKCCSIGQVRDWFQEEGVIGCVQCRWWGEWQHGARGNSPGVCFGVNESTKSVVKTVGIIITFPTVFSFRIPFSSNHSPKISHKRSRGWSSQTGVEFRPQEDNHLKVFWGAMGINSSHQPFLCDEPEVESTFLYVSWTLPVGAFPPVRSSADMESNQWPSFLKMPPAYLRPVLTSPLNLPLFRICNIISPLPAYEDSVLSEHELLGGCIPCRPADVIFYDALKENHFASHGPLPASVVGWLLSFISTISYFSLSVCPWNVWRIRLASKADNKLELYLRSLAS